MDYRLANEKRGFTFTSLRSADRYDLDFQFVGIFLVLFRAAFEKWSRCGAIKK